MIGVKLGGVGVEATMMVRIAAAPVKVIMKCVVATEDSGRATKIQRSRCCAGFVRIGMRGVVPTMQ